MLNENRLNMLQNVIISQLANAITERNPDKPVVRIDDQEVFSRLTDLYDEAKEMQFGKETGKSYKFMPKQYKEMVMRLIAPNYAFTYRTSGTNTDTSVTVEAFLFLNYSDEKPIAVGKATVSYTDAPVDFNNDEWAKKMYCESAAKGLAESKALQKYGIGSWYSYSYEPEENPDVAMNEMQKKDDMNPQVAYDATTQSIVIDQPKGDSNSQVQNIANFTIAEPSIENEVHMENMDSKNLSECELNQVNTENSNNASDVINTEKEETTNTSGEITELEEARNMKAECGKALSMGLTLGETADKYPGNILWMYMKGNVSDSGKKALLVIAKNYPEIKQAFNDNGINV